MSNITRNIYIFTNKPTFQGIYRSHGHGRLACQGKLIMRSANSSKHLCKTKQKYVIVKTLEINIIKKTLKKSMMTFIIIIMVICNQFFKLLSYPRSLFLNRVIRVPSPPHYNPDTQYALSIYARWLWLLLTWPFFRTLIRSWWSHLGRHLPIRSPSPYKFFRQSLFIHPIFKIDI